MRRVASLLLASAAASMTVPAAALAQETPATPSASTRPATVPGASETGLAPDIIVIMVDDLGYIPDERVLERLPAIKARWLDGGLRFEQLHTETPLCAPSRAALLTGQHTLQHGVITNDGDPMDPSTTLATTLDDAGYHTMLVGKYLNRYEGTRTPPGWDQVFMRESPVASTYTENGEFRRFRDQHFDDVVREQAVAWLRDAPLDEPTFELVAPRAPHRHPQQCKDLKPRPTGCAYLPMPMVEDRGAAACADLEPYKPPDYATPKTKRPVPWRMPDWPDGWPLEATCESLLVIDRMVAELGEAQAERGRDAWFVFMSDNGMAWGRDGGPGKHIPASTRLPFYVAGPGTSAGGTDALVSNVDIAPTLAELAGAAAPSAVGTSFVPLLRGEPFDGRDELLEIMPRDPQDIYEGWTGLRTPEWHYVRWEDGRAELYDLRADPWEEQDLAKAQPERVERMSARLDELVAASAEPAGADTDAA